MHQKERVILMRASTLDEWADGANAAVLTISRKEAAMLVDLMKENQRLHEEYGSIATIEVWWGGIDWIGALPDELEEKYGEDHDPYDGDWVAELEGMTPEELTKKIDEKNLGIRSDCDMAAVWNDHVVFTAYMKYVDHVSMETARLSRNQLAALACGEPLPAEMMIDRDTSNYEE